MPRTAASLPSSCASSLPSRWTSKFRPRVPYVYLFIALADSSHLGHITHMPEVEKSIYYLAGESLAAVRDSPSLGEVLKKKGFEAPIIDPIDKYATMQLKEFHGRKPIYCRYYQQQTNNSEQPLTMVSRAVFAAANVVLCLTSCADPSHAVASHWAHQCLIDLSNWLIFPLASPSSFHKFVAASARSLT